MPADGVVPVSGTERGHDTRPGEENELPLAIDRDVARIEDALRRIGSKGDGMDRQTADRLAEQVREFAFEVGGNVSR